MKKEYCQHCGQPVMKHKHSLTKSLARILTLIPLMSEFHLQKHLKLTKNEYANFQKLKYWGLVEKVYGKSGYWIVTTLGRKFVFGEISVPRTVITFNNRVIDQSMDVTNMRSAHGFWKTREEYARDSEPALATESLF